MRHDAPGGMMHSQGPRLEGTKQAILERLVPGERHVLAVASELRIRESAIRRHFDQLEAAGYVEGFFRQEGLGRPKKYYQLTPWGRETFPRALADALERDLRAIVQSGRAATPEDAVFVLAQDRVQHHRARFAAAQSPLAKGRAIERVLTELGIPTRARVEGETIFLDCTGTLVLRAAIHRRDELPDRWRERLLDAIRRLAAHDEARHRIVEGDRLCPPAVPA